MKLLIVEDELALATGLRFNFEAEGYEVELAGDGPSAIEAFENADPPFDLVILDLMLPTMSGYQICRHLRELDEEVPILVLSARTLSEDRAMAFDVGTDQYMTKPFALPELLARVRNLLERRRRTPAAVGNAPATERSSYELGSVTIDFDKFEVERDGETHRLTSIQCQLLKYFIENEGIVLSRMQIMEDVWNDPGDTTRSIDNVVMRLRRLIEPDPSKPQHLVSVRGTGYRFDS